MPNPVALDLDRRTFSQKLSLAAALGIIESSSMPAYKALNTLRNRIAHELMPTLDKRAVGDLYNCLSVAQQQTLSALPSVDPLRSLRDIVAVLYSQLRATLELRRERRLRVEAYNDITRETLRGANYGQAWAESRRSLEDGLRKRVDAKKSERGWTYISPGWEYGPWDPYNFEFITPQ